MLRSWPLWVLGTAAMVGAAAAGPDDLLRNAFLAGSGDEVERAGRHAGARRLSVVLAGGDRILAMAAADAAPAAEDAVWLLEPLAVAARSPDRPLALRAARAAARIGGNLDRGALLEGDIPLDWVRARIAELRAISSDAGRWTDVRVSALEAAARLHRALDRDAGPADSPYDLAATAADPDPELRRAALELLASPLRPAELTIAAKTVIGDKDLAVAIAAGQAACEGLTHGDPARPVLAALGAKGLARLRLLVANKALSLGARRGAARCLAADGSRASKKALASLPGRRRKR